MPEGQRPASPLQSLLHLLHRASQRADAVFARHVDDDLLTPRQFVVLQAVAESDGLSQTAIMAATGIDRSSMADLVRRLVSLGLLRRRRTRQDARQYAVRLTREGRQRLSLGLPAARATEDLVLTLLPPRRRDGFIKCLSLIAMAPDDAH
jgi:DNA-binding MarR family transcriptional regulator